MEQDNVEWIKECAKKSFYKGFEKCKNDDANCFTAWREEAPELILSFTKPVKAKEKQGNSESEDEIYIDVVRLVEKDNIRCELYSDTVKKLMDKFEIKRKL